LEVILEHGTTSLRFILHARPFPVLSHPFHFHPHPVDIQVYEVDDHKHQADLLSLWCISPTVGVEEAAPDS
jgi:hypothetical protein